jgi:hypothetical protein
MSGKGMEQWPFYRGTLLVHGRIRCGQCRSRWQEWTAAAGTLPRTRALASSHDGRHDQLARTSHDASAVAAVAATVTALGGCARCLLRGHGGHIGTWYRGRNVVA